jgi:hypothetical protein
MDPIWIAAALTVIVLIGVLGYAFGPGGFIVFWIIVKSIVGYGWKFLAPIWVVVKQKKWYKVLAIFVVFGGFLAHFYSFLKTGDISLLNAATNALAATITGSLMEIAQSGKVLIGSASIQKKLIALLLFASGVARVILWYVAWRMIKNKFPGLFFLTITSLCLYLISWGSNDANALFEVFDFAGTAADQAAEQAMLNSTNG